MVLGIVQSVRPTLTLPYRCKHGVILCIVSFNSKILIEPQIINIQTMVSLLSRLMS